MLIDECYICASREMDFGVSFAYPVGLEAEGPLVIYLAVVGAVLGELGTDGDSLEWDWIGGGHETGLNVAVNEKGLTGRFLSKSFMNRCATSGSSARYSSGLCIPY